MYTFLTDGYDSVRGHGLTPFLFLFAYVWVVWALKALAASRYRPSTAWPIGLTTTVLVPVFREPVPVLRRTLASIRAEQPTELIAIIDGADAQLAELAGELCDRVLRIPRSGKRAAIAHGLRASDPQTDIVLVVDSDTMWLPGMLTELLSPFEDARVGGVTPRQAIRSPRSNGVRRLADWIESLRYNLTVPAQSLFGQVGCLAGRTIAYRREAFEPAVERLVRQTVLGVPQHIGDDRVLTNELLRSGWRTVYQSTAWVLTEAPDDWGTFWRQQLRWGRSSQRETLLSLGWLWRKPVACACFLTDIATPFALYAVLALGVAHGLHGDGGPTGLPLTAELPLAYAGMVISIGLRQIGHFRRHPEDVVRLPLFVLQLTFVLVPTRMVAFATMLHQSWSTRPDPVYELMPNEAVRFESAH